MKFTIGKKCKWTAALSAAFLALAFFPLHSAQAQTPSGSQAAAQPTSATVVNQIKQLQDEVNALQGEIATLKQKGNAAPTATPVVFHEAAASQPASEPIAMPATATAATAVAQASTPKISLAKLLGPTTLSGLVDTYYGYDFNHPSNMQTGLQFFDANENQFGLNMIELSAIKTPTASSGVAGRTGYDLTVGFGQAMNAINGTGPNSDGALSGAQYLKEGYLSYLAPVGKGLKIDVGKFVTTAGEEVIETNADWNYTRSILFYYAMPFYHFGVRATYAPNSKISLQASITNGWNDIVAPNNTKTYGGSISYTPDSKWGFTETYYAGPVDSINYWRQLSDTIISYSPNAKWAFVLHGDYGRDVVTTGGPVADWWGPAGYVKYAFSPNDNVAVRYEYYDDPEGLTLFSGFGFNGGHAQEVTTTYTHMIANSLMTRFEFRHDFASQPIFQRGAVPDAVKNQNSVVIGLIYSFSSQESH